MPLVTWVKVVSVNNMIAGSSLGLKHLISLIVVSLKEILEVEIVRFL